MFSLKYSARAVFYTQKITSRVRIGRNRALYRVAATVRTASRRTLWPIKQGPSQAPRPPHVHTRGGLREIRFVVDEAAGAALIGPVKFPGSKFLNEPVPHVQEFGGNFVRPGRGSYSYYPERSYMNFTLKKLIAQGYIPRQFRASMAEVL